MNNGVEIVCKMERFYALEKHWGDLLYASNKDDLGYFNSWVWAVTWWKVYAKTTDVLFIVCQWEQGKLVALAPFYIKHANSGLVKTLLFIGTGEPEEIEVATEYLDLLVLKEGLDQFVDTLVAEIGRIQAVVKLDFSNVLENSLCLNALVPKLKKDFIPRQRVCGYRYVATLSKDTETGSLPKSQIKKYHVSNRRYIRSGDANCLLVTNEPDLDYGMETLSELHQKRWQSKGKHGVFSACEFQQFHKMISKSLLSNNDLLMFVIRLKDKPLAVYYGWRFKDTLSYYQSGIDTTTKPNMSPGLLMHVEAMQWGKCQGLARYDFMKGGETSYKSHYAEKTQAMYQIRLYKKSIRSCFFNIGAYLNNRIRSFL